MSDEEHHDNMSVDDEDGGGEEEEAVQVAAVPADADDDEEEEPVVAVVEEVDDDDDVNDSQDDDGDNEEAVETAPEVPGKGDDDDDDEENGEKEDAPVAEQPQVVVALEEVNDVVEEDVPVVEAVAVVEEPTKLAPTKTKAKPTKASTKSKKKPASSTNKSSSKTTKAPASSKRKTASGSTGILSLGRVDSKRMEAANAAREMLYEAVPRLPFLVTDSTTDQYYIRNFGRLKIGKDEASSKFATPNALYPVGFSCDRYEFSPSHGRNLKLRCSILDGKTIGETGPVFRVMWGRGVDEDVDKVEYPYDPFTNSNPIFSDDNNEDEDNVVALPATLDDHHVVPTPGMRVKARYTKDDFYFGTISKVTEKQDDTSGKSKKKNVFDITIEYDGGYSEECAFPDPDISLVMPGKDDEVDKAGQIARTELNGKPVQTAIGKTPLEAWSLALTKLGLVDEVIVDRAMETLETARETTEFTSTKTAKEEAYEQEAVEDDENPETLDPDAEPYSKKEIILRERLEVLKKEYGEAFAGDNALAAELADARVSLIGPGACNPFPDGESSTQNQASFLAVAVRREKNKMGSTGNKRKVVNISDLLERGNTFVNPDVEALMEGLPGSEYCSNYIFLKKRGNTTVSKAWVEEQALIAKREEEREKAKKLKASKETAAKASQNREKERKRKRIQDERDAKKRQKMEEEEGVRKQREEARLAKLQVQVEERLSKEANFQREKVIIVLAKNLNKEMNRRRKAAELVAGQVVAETKSLPASPLDLPETPPLGTMYDEDVLRLWDFLNTFNDYFVKRNYFESAPTLDELQSAMDALHGKESSKLSKKDAIAYVTDLAVSLCKPLSVGLTRMLFTSLIALNPTIQKEFNAAYWTEDGGGKNHDENAEIENAFTNNVLLPVNDMTWKEIARIALLADALGELGFSKQEMAHYIRGYRSTGHPNSKESQRLRKMEGVGMECLHQQFAEHRIKDDGYRDNNNIVLLKTPSSPQCHHSDWEFYLHNIKALKLSQKDEMQRNLRNAIESLKLSQAQSLGSAPENSLSELEKCLSLVQADSKKAKEDALSLLDSATGHVYSRKTIGTIVQKNVLHKTGPEKLRRPCMGQLERLFLSPTEVKNLGRLKEQYMSNAMFLKEELKRQELKEAGEAEDDDDDDDDEDDEEDVESQKPKVVKSEETGMDPPEDGVSGQEEPIQESKIESVANEAMTKAENSKDVKMLDGKPKDSQQKIGKETEYDDFCGDIPTAPELIRRCLAVLRALIQSGPGDAFIYPVDPQLNPNYYEQLLRPMCFREVGVKLQEAAKLCESMELIEAAQFAEKTVAEFARNIRLIAKNTISYTNAGPMVVSAGGEMLRIFERLLLDWVLAPEDKLPSLEMLDDDMCVESHPSDLESTVLLCDGCEGKYNISRLSPPLQAIPQGEWYCPRCLGGCWWGNLDPRIGKNIVVDGFSAKIHRCLFTQPERTPSRPSLMYELQTASGKKLFLMLQEVDAALKKAGQSVPRIRCLEAVAESPGYSAGIDHGRFPDIVPVLVNPNVSDGAAQMLQCSSVFKDSISTVGTLMVNDTEEMTANEWLRLLTLLLMKCASSEPVQHIASEMESKAAERLSKAVESISKISDFAEALPVTPFVDDSDEEADEENKTDGMQGDIGGSTDFTVVLEEVPSNHPSNSQKEVPEDREASTGATEPVVVSAVQIDAMEIDGIPSRSDVAFVQANPATTEEDEEKKARTMILGEKARRQKAREESIAAFCIKNQLRSTVASFEQDNVSSLVESTLAPKVPGLSFLQTRCRGIFCDFCGLSDTTLGTNLVRVPNEREWSEYIVHATKSRQTQLIADMRAHSRIHPKKLMKICIRIGGDLISSDPDEINCLGTKDGGMLEFLPRNPDGFQDELLFRYNAGLPFISGSMTGHSVCALAAHNARKVKMLEKYKERETLVAEREAGISCGRTLEIGTDGAGRSYWHFNSDLGSLFVCNPSELGPSKWQRFSEPELISSVIVALGRDPLVPELKRTFPKAASLILDGSWSELLMKRRYKLNHSKRDETASDSGMDDGDVTIEQEEEELFEEGEHVLVESKCETMLWDAQVVGLAKDTSGSVAYRVHYKGWSSRFDEWVSADRVVEPNTSNKEVQQDMLTDSMKEKELPSVIESMKAKSFLRSRDRLRGNLPLPDFHRIAFAPPNASSNEKTFVATKAALLAVEAALPVGSIDNTAKGPWRADLAKQWRLKVLQTQGAWDLMRCVLHLEESILEDWVRPDLGHLRSGLPVRAKALEEASPSSLAIRVNLLDQSLAYKLVDKKRFKSKKR